MPSEYPPPKLSAKVRIKDIDDALIRYRTGYANGIAKDFVEPLKPSKRKGSKPAVSADTAKRFFEGRAISYAKALKLCELLYSDEWNPKQWKGWLVDINEENTSVLSNDGDDSEGNFGKTDDFYSLIQQRTRRFVGRAEVFDAIGQYFSRMQSDNRGSYFTVVGDPGEGKSSILAWYVREINPQAEAYFNLSNMSGYSAATFQEEICKRLIQRFELEDINISDVSWDDGRTMNAILHQISQLLRTDSKQLVIVVDALDEVDLENHKPDNILYLPIILPANVHVLMSRRRIADEELRRRRVSLGYQNQRIYDLRDYTENSQRDIAKYIDKCLDIQEADERYEEFKGFSKDLYNWIDEQDISTDEFKRTLIKNSAENFMYVSLVLQAIADGQYDDRSLSELPQNLEEYYKDHWIQMRVDTERARIIFYLCEFEDPMSPESWARMCKKNYSDVIPVLEGWKSFLHTDRSYRPPRYSIYHKTYIDFLSNHPIVQASVGQSEQEAARNMVDGLLRDIEF